MKKNKLLSKVFSLYTKKTTHLNKNPKVLVVADQCFWAYHEIQKYICRHMSDKYDVYTDYNIFYKPLYKTTWRYDLLRWKSCFLALPHRRMADKDVVYDIVLLLGFYFPLERKIAYKTKYLIKGIYTHGIPPSGVACADKHISLEQFIVKYLDNADSVVCGSKMIADQYKEVIPHVKYANGFDGSKFKRLTSKVKNMGSRFVVGWTGNPRREFKGFYDYIVPAVEEAAKKRPGIELKTRFSGPVKTLPRFYDDVDVVLVASVGDAGPGTFLEGCLCDVPTISNYSGVPAEIIEDNVNGLFVEREITAMSNAIIKLYDDRELLFSFSKRIRSDYLKIRSDKKVAQAWDEVFKDVLKL